MAEFGIDGRLAHRRFGAAANTATHAGFLGRELARRMLERLDPVRLQPQRILDLGCGGGADLALLAARYPQARCIGADFALPLLQQHDKPGVFSRLLTRRRTAALLCANADAIPLANASVQMVWSNLMLNWLSDPLPALKEMHRVLAVEGLVMFTTLGPDTLKELRSTLPATRGERVHRFIDMHDIGDALVNAGFSAPVMDVEYITLTYENMDALFADLRAGGCTNAATTRPRGLAGKAGWTQARAAYEKLRNDGRLPVTVEVVFGHAWKPEPRVTDDGRAIIRFQPKR